MSSRILFLSRTCSNRGGGILVVKLAQQLRLQGFDVDMAAFKVEGSPDFPNCENLWSGMNVSITPIKKAEDPDRQLILFAEAGCEFLQKHHYAYDRIVLDSWANCHAVIKSGIPLDIVYHLVQSEPNTTTIHHPSLWLDELLQLLPHFPVNRIGVSLSIAKLFEQKYAVVMPVIPLFIDNAYHQASFEVINTSQPLRFVSSSGNFNEPSKGLDFLLEQLTHFKECPFSLTLLTANEIAQDLSGYPFEIKVISASNPQEMIAVLEQHDVYINTSTKEAFCFALAEAITMGMPCIALDSIGNREYFSGDNYIFVEDKSKFLSELAKLRVFELRNQLHRKAKSSMSNFTLPVTVEALKNIIKVS